MTREELGREVRVVRRLSSSLVRKASNVAQACLLHRHPRKPWPPLYGPLLPWDGACTARSSTVMVRVVRGHVFKKLPCASATAGPV